MDSSNPTEMVAPRQETSEVPKEKASELAKEEKTSEVPKEEKASEAPPKAKKAKKKFADIWVLKAEKQRKGDVEETVIGAYSSKDKAIRNALRAMQNFEGRQGFVDNSEEIGERGGVVYSYHRDEYYSVSIDKVSLDKTTSFDF